MLYSLPQSNPPHLIPPDLVDDPAQTAAAILGDEPDDPPFDDGQELLFARSMLRQPPAQASRRRCR